MRPSAVITRFGGRRWPGARASWRPRRSSRRSDVTSPACRRSWVLRRMSLNYEIRVRGRVGDQLLDALALAAEVAPVETVLRGPVVDQEHLRGTLDRLLDLGLELIEVRRLPAVDP